MLGHYDKAKAQLERALARRAAPERRGVVARWSRRDTTVLRLGVGHDVQVSKVWCQSAGLLASLTLQVSRAVMFWIPTPNAPAVCWLDHT